MLVTAAENRANKRWAWFASAACLLFPFLLSFGLDAFQNGEWIYYCLPGAFVAILVFIVVQRRVAPRFAISCRPSSAPLDLALAKEVAFYRGLDRKDREHFQRLVRLFLEDVSIIGVDTTVDDQVRMLVAASAVIPVFGLPNWKYRLSTVLVYPGPLSPSITGMEEGNQAVIGQAQTTSGRVLLSKPHLLAGYKNPVDRKNVGLHEFAHMVDAADGSIDGALAAPGEDQEGWRRLMEEALQAPERAHVLMDPYGFTNEGEFFACLTESFFETPLRLKEKNPELFDYLVKFYGRDPVATLKDARRGKQRPRKIGRNSRCPCGSGQKFKRCCLGKTVEPLPGIFD